MSKETQDNVDQKINLRDVMQLFELDVHNEFRSRINQKFGGEIDVDKEAIQSWLKSISEDIDSGTVYNAIDSLSDRDADPSEVKDAMVQASASFLEVYVIYHLFEEGKKEN